VTVSCAQVASGSAPETGVSGSVWRGDQPARLAYIRLSRPDGEYMLEIRISPAGRFHIPVPPGEWSLVCLAPRAARLEQPLKLARGDVFEVQFRLDDAA
jgi:hypothetical protein